MLFNIFRKPSAKDVISNNEYPHDYEKTTQKGHKINLINKEEEQKSKCVLFTYIGWVTIIITKLFIISNIKIAFRTRPLTIQ